MLKTVKAIAFSMFMSVMGLVTLTGCDSLIFDSEGDCDVVYRVKFKYDKNLKWADAFANEVKSVRLYAFDSDGVLVRRYDETGSVLADPDYSIELDLEPGTYRLLAWCGIDNAQAQADHFSIPESTVGVTTLTEMTCKLNRYADAAYGSVNNLRHEFMFHGLITAELPADDDGGEFVYTIPLTKDTNHVRIILQHLSGEDVDKSQFSFRFDDNNGFYAHDNALLDDEAIVYLPFDVTDGVAGLLGDDSGLKNAKTAIADFSIGRIMADHRNKLMLTITNKDGKNVARVPIVDYALLSKQYYAEAYDPTITDQDLLDRMDEYEMTFFIDENQKWVSAQINIESWRTVIQNYEID